VELYLHSPICLHGVVLKIAQGQLHLYLLLTENKVLSRIYESKTEKEGVNGENEATSSFMSTKAEPHYPAENPKDLL
jgi:hypothetical protein